MFSGTYFPLCGVDEAMVYVNGTDGGTAEELGRAMVACKGRLVSCRSIKMIEATSSDYHDPGD
jgi:hypothetical protein